MKAYAIILFVLLVGCGGAGGGGGGAVKNTNAECPDGYVLVLPLAPYTDHAFCIAQYEMRYDAGLPVSRSDGEQWKLPRDHAQQACESIGKTLPTNAQWQTMARQAEQLPVNWSDNMVGSGTLNASVTILPNGSVLYNLGDGVWEQVAGELAGETGSTSLIYLISASTHSTLVEIDGVRGYVKDHFGPQGNYQHYPYDPGLGIMTNRYSQSIMRGGDDEEPGLFGAAVNHGPTDYSNDVGFRCAT